MAPPGTGKTAGIAIPTLLLLKNSVIINDIKGELHQLTGHVRSTFSRVLVFDPAKPGSAVFNPFASNILPKGEGAVHTHVSRMAATLIRSQRNTDEFFTEQARGLFSFIAEWLIIQEGETNICAVYKELFKEQDIVASITKMLEDENLSERMIATGHAILSNSVSKNQWAGIIGTLDQALRIFLDESVAAATTGNSQITVTSLRQETTTVYVTIRDQDQERLKNLVAMLFEYISQELIKEIPDEDAQPVTLILDEFPRLGRLESIRNLPAISRGYKVNIMFIAQDYGQIIQTYDKDAADIIDSSTAYKIIMRQNSHQSAERISKLVGKNTVQKKSTSQKSGELIGGSTSTSEEGVPFLSEQDVMRIQKDECIVLVEGFQDMPIKAKIPFWFEEPELTKLVHNTA